MDEIAPSDAARSLSARGVAARRRNNAAVRRILAAWRRVHPEHRRSADGDVLEALAAELEHRAERGAA